MAEGSTIQIAISSAVLLGVAGFIIVRFLTGYDSHKKDIYDKLGKKVDKDTCKEFRDSGRDK